MYTVCKISLENLQKNFFLNYSAPASAPAE